MVWNMEISWNFMEIHHETCTAPENGDIKNQIGFELDWFLGICWL